MGELKFSLGCIQDSQDDRDLMFSSQVSVKANKLPKVIDTLVPVINELPVKNQGSIGCCVGCSCGMAATALMRFQNYKWPFTASALALYAMVREFEGTPLTEDSGAMIRDAFKVMNTRGLIPEDSNPKWSWPFSVSDNRWTKMPHKEALDAGLKHLCVKYMRLGPDPDAIRQALYEGMPVVIGMNLKESFMSAKTEHSGVYKPTRQEDFVGGHAMFLFASGLYKRDWFTGRNSWGCYDDRTEVLTNDGWKLFKDVSRWDTVATLNPTTHNLEYQPILKKHEYVYDGELHRYRSDYVDLLVTPNHNMFVQGKEKSMPWKTVRSDQITQKYIHFKKNANWEGKEEDTITIANHQIPMDTWLEFLGYFVSEGHLSHRTFTRPERERVRKYRAGDKVERDTESGRFIAGTANVMEKTYVTTDSARTQNDWVIGVTQTKSNNLNKIQACLDKLPFRFTRHGKTWTCNNLELFRHLQPLGKSPKRFIPTDLLKLSSRQLKILFDALMLGDGHISPKVSKMTYYTSSKHLADNIQEIAVKIGLAADIGVSDRRDQKTSKGYNYNELEYAVNLKRKRLSPSYINKFLKEPYSGVVYCLTVPNHLMLVRRNGKAVWCGNSDWGNDGNFHVPHEVICDSYYTSDRWAISTVT